MFNHLQISKKGKVKKTEEILELANTWDSVIKMYYELREAASVVSQEPTSEDGDGASQLIRKYSQKVYELLNKDTQGILFIRKGVDFHPERYQKMPKRVDGQSLSYDEINNQLGYKQQEPSEVYTFKVSYRFSKEAQSETEQLIYRLFKKQTQLTVMCIPYVALNELIAFQILIVPGGPDLTDKLLRTCNVIADMIMDHYLVRKQASMISSFEGLIKSLSVTLEKKDVYTSGHSDRVAEISKLIAIEMGLDAELTESIWVAGLMHDLGKIGIKDDVLTKPGHLSAVEFSLIQQHPQITKEILKPVRNFYYHNIINMAYYHHENYDGSGYPDKISGEAIPLGARIIKVADCLDAMTSHRSYKTNKTHEEAIEDLRLNVLKQFDPVVVEATIAIFDHLPLLDKSESVCVEKSV